MTLRKLVQYLKGVVRKAKDKYLGYIIWKQRERLHLTRKELSIQSNISIPQIGSIERGINFPSAQSFHKIAVLLDLSEQDLLKIKDYLASISYKPKHRKYKSIINDPGIIDDKFKNENIGEILHQRRKAMHLTMKKLAEDIGVSISYIHRIEKGTRIPTVPVIQRLGESLGYSKKELFALTGVI